MNGDREHQGDDGDDDVTHEPRGVHARWLSWKRHLIWASAENA